MLIISDIYSIYNTRLIILYTKIIFYLYINVILIIYFIIKKYFIINKFYALIIVIDGISKVIIAFFMIPIVTNSNINF
uniref:Uncharacterized protein n=1 Tax=Candidatus Aschnera chinzeii TaxID=1485666 RepID=A0AAT9G5B8_9ENTR|nr:MAG: hypothetical protein ACHINZ_5840 [Candidatus Aschnera chinzeii]